MATDAERFVSIDEVFKFREHLFSPSLNLPLNFLLRQLLSPARCYSVEGGLREYRVR